MQAFLNNYSIRKGLHFYINIKNFDKLVANDEKDDDMSHMFHYLNTFLTSLERYIRDNFDTNQVIVEKLTGSRIHIIVYGDCRKAFIYFLNISNFAFKLSNFILTLSKYKTLTNIGIQIGADFGVFNDLTFKDGEFEEYTSIGYPANFACKLQSIALSGEILISKRIVDNIPPINGALITKLDYERQNQILKKYPDSGNLVYAVSSSSRSIFYESLNKQLFFESLDNKRINFEDYFELAKRLANKTDYQDMDTIEPHKMNFDKWNIKKSAKFNAAIVFADVRGFTKMFSPNGSNLSQMSRITKDILATMYDKCASRSGVHVQFQGDREFVFFPENEIKNSILFALELNLRVAAIFQGIAIGIGISVGKVYATQIGLESEDDNFVKQNIMLGNTIKDANELEDLCAKEGEITISDKVYNHKFLIKEIRSLFSRRDYYWVSSSNFNDFIKLTLKSEEERNRSENIYKPWNAV